MSEVPSPGPIRPAAVSKLFRRFRRTVFSLSFWLGLTMGFPLEHFLWERVWPFKLITLWMTLH
jgi:hypothetical protein